MIALSRFPAQPLRAWHVAALAAAVALAPATAWAVWPVLPYVNVPVCTDPSAPGSFVILGTGGGDCFAAWTDSRTGSSQFYLRHFVNGAGDTRWPVQGLRVVPQSAIQSSPQLFPDGAGGVIAVWQDRRSGIALNYVQHVLADGTLDALWPATGQLLSAASQTQYPVSGTGDPGASIVSWNEYRIASGSEDVLAQRVSGSGLDWGSTALLVCGAANSQLMEDVVSDNTGGAIITWVDDRAGSFARDVYAHRVSAAGVLDTRWPTGGTAVCTATNSQGGVDAAPDGAQGAMLAWNDSRRGGGAVDLYAHHLRGDGAVDPVWPANGLLVQSDCSQYAVPRVVPDGVGGALVFGVDTIPFVHHVRSDGTKDPAWPASGVRLTGKYYDVLVESDGAGAMLLAVQIIDPTAGDDLAALRLLPSGTWDPAWPAAGCVVSNAAQRQFVTAVAGDGAGGLFVGWSDERNYAATGWDLYAQHVNGDGTLGHPTPAITAIEDEPADQGGRVMLAWSASEGDAAPNGYVTSYMLWRRVTNLASAQAPALASEPGALEPGDVRQRGEGLSATWWEYLATVPATRFPAYAYTAATTADARPGETPWNVFVVDAVDDAWWSFYPSAPDSGYSVDNLAPHFPAPCFGWYANGATHLTWPPSPEPDFSHYRLYRLPRIDSPIDEGTRIASPTDTGYVDAPGYPCYYAINAVDVHGNSSPNGLIDPFGVAGIDGEPLPRDVTLAAAGPNPARGLVQLRFALPRAAEATLRVHDVHGRLVRRLVHGPYGAGWHGATWDGRDEAGHGAAPGVYLVRLDVAGGPACARRIVRLE